MRKPEIPPYRYHAILCCGEKCDSGAQLLQYAKRRLMECEIGDVRMNRAGCLGVCMQGPIMVVYPDGVWYCNLDEARIDEIIERHFRGGEPVEEIVFHRVG